MPKRSLSSFSDIHWMNALPRGKFNLYLILFSPTIMSFGDYLSSFALHCNNIAFPVNCNTNTLWTKVDIYFETTVRMLRVKEKHSLGGKSYMLLSSGVSRMFLAG